MAHEYDRRSEPRIGASEKGEVVALTLLGQQSPTAPLPANMVDLSGRGLGLLCGTEVVVGTLVRVNGIRIDGGEAMLLGEVCYCRACDGGFQVGVQLEHSLCNLAQLETLRLRLLGAEAGLRTQLTPVA